MEKTLQLAFVIEKIVTYIEGAAISHVKKKLIYLYVFSAIRYF